MDEGVFRAFHGEELRGEHDEVPIEDLRPVEDPKKWKAAFKLTKSLMRPIARRDIYLDSLDTNKDFTPFYPYLYRLDDLVFNEKLYLFDQNEDQVGEFTLNVVRMEHLTHLKVNIQSEFSNNRVTAAMKAEGVVDLKYRTMYEQRREYEDINDVEMLRIIHLERTPQCYKVIALSHGDIEENNFQNEKWHFPPDFKNVFTETSFLILLRQLVQKDAKGLFDLKLLFINGDLCRCKLKAKRFCIFNWYKRPIKIKRFFKVVVCPNGKKQSSQIVMTNRGQLLYQDWSDTDLVMSLHKDAMLFYDMKIPKDPENLVPLRERFYERREIFDFYTDEYHKNIDKYKSYFHDKPEVMQLLNFLLKEILLKKPHRVCEFASNYFCELI